MAWHSARPEVPHVFHIESGTLAQTLNRLAEQGDSVLVYAAALTLGL